MENPSPLTHIIVHNAYEHNLKNLNLLADKKYFDENIFEEDLKKLGFKIQNKKIYLKYVTFC